MVLGRVALGCAIALFAPFIAIRVFMIASGGSSTLVNYAFYGSIAIGGIGIAIVPVRAWIRIAAAVVYVPALSVLLANYVLVFACNRFHQCL